MVDRGGEQTQRVLAGEKVLGSLRLSGFPGFCELLVIFFMLGLTKKAFK